MTDPDDPAPTATVDDEAPEDGAAEPSDDATATESAADSDDEGGDADGDAAEAGPQKWRRTKWVFTRRLCFGGLAGALVFFCLSMTPSLLPRAAIMQGVVSGVAVAIGYGLGSALSALIRKVDPDIIFSAATSRSPRSVAGAEISPDVRSALQRATFGMWLPAHLLPTTRLVEAAHDADCAAPIVTSAFPDVVNPAIWRHHGFGPAAGSGNGEVSAAMLQHYLASTHAVPLSDVEVAVGTPQPVDTISSPGRR